MANVNYKPAGYHTVTPYLTVMEPERLIEFLTQAFDGQATEALKDADGRIQHAEVRIGDSMLMIGGAREAAAVKPAVFYLYVPDTDALYQRALAAGGISLMEPADQFYGDRNAGVQDPLGNTWWIATHKEEMSAEELQRRSDARYSQS